MKMCVLTVRHVNRNTFGWNTHSFNEVAQFNSDSEEPGRAVQTVHIAKQNTVNATGTCIYMNIVTSRTHK